MVTLRAKKLSTSRFHLFLDVTKGGRRQKKYLKLYVSQDYTKPQTNESGELIYDKKGFPISKPILPVDNEHWVLANNIKTEILNDLNKSRYDFDEEKRLNSSFTQYFFDYVEKEKYKKSRVPNAVFQQFLQFTDNQHVKAKHVDEDFVLDFACHLKNKLKYETPYKYFMVFKRVVRKGYKCKILLSNVAEDISIKKKKGAPKDILCSNELRRLYATPAKDEVVKRAFLFTCYTGLDYNDVKNYFKWENVKEYEEGLMIHGNRGKTGSEYLIPLHAEAIKLIGERMGGDSLVFDMPAHHNVTKILNRWMEDAGVNKHITYHCGRHSLCMNLLYNGVAIHDTSKIMTHSRVQETEGYARRIGAMKNKSIHQLPSLSEVSN